MGYRDERTLVRHLLRYLKEAEGPWGSVRIKKEFYYQNGRTDVIAVSNAGEILAFEAKLKKWREALQQAYRNTSFAHRSYVVLPEKTAMLAGRFISEFDRRRVGLCAVNGEGLHFLNDPPKAEPIQQWLAERALTFQGGARRASVVS